ncbi:unnamed protein product [Paramecium sonneborni]|uniref:Metalloenzyme domain-containing protein n=1 Tax=Paramecium sonneborni TaxID=65129 RepID=A0A8S1KLH7_9CILI|nr:unnamed protein product [Paramecium sonneborni]
MIYEKCLIKTLVLFCTMGLLLFFKGYFIDRRYLLDRSKGTMKPTQPVILLVIDSLRIDLAFSQNFTFIKKMSKEKPDQTLFFLSLAEVPTVTGPRLQAMTSGNFPPLSKLLDNFHASIIKEDNLLFQMNRFNKKTFFVGDDIWMGLYPDQFTVQFPKKSSNINDLSSIDEFISLKLNKNINQGYDLIVAHFQGLDHAGHKNNKVLNNQDLEDQLGHTDGIIAQIYEKMSNDTILLITGDHGMANDGNHGGNSTEETNTLLFAIKKQGKFYPKYMESIPQLKDNYQSTLVNQSQYIRKISQIDLVPTLAILLGIPIPYSNLGYLINEFFNSEKHCLDNLKQVMNFVETIHNRQGKFTYSQKSQWQNQYQNVKNCKDALILMNDIQVVARKIWNEYNFPLLHLSFLLQFLIFIFFIFTMIVLKQSSENDDHIKTQEIISAFKHALQDNQKLTLFLVILAAILFFMYEIEILITIVLTLILFYFDFILFIKIKKNRILRQNQQQWSLIQQPIQNPTDFDKLIKISLYLFFIYKIILQGQLLLSIQELQFEENYLYKEINKLLMISSIICILNLIFRLINQLENESIFSKIKDTIISCATAMIIYYALNFEQLYYLKNEGYEFLLQFRYLMYLSVIFLHVCLFMYQKESPILDKILAQFGLVLIDIFYTYLNVLCQGQPYRELVILHIPKIIYLISFYYFFSKDPIFLFLSCVVVSDTNGLMIYSCEILIFILLYFHWKSLLKFQMISFFAMLSLICQITWFIFGNLCTISSIKLERAFVGVQDFHLWLNPFILAFFLLGPYLAGLIFIRYIGPQLCKQGELIDTQVRNSKNLFKLMFLFNFYIQIQFTQIHSYKNAGGLIDIQFKYIFDAVTFFTVCLFMFLI